VLRLKDVEYALQFAHELGIAMPFGEVARKAFRQLRDLGHGNSNESRIIDVARIQRSE
jgi:3-hydroxyisobutyrate dehydrogenase-like beta-hydroxyacid dehydrogenase